MMKIHAKPGAVLVVALGAVALAGWSALPPFPFRPDSRLWVEGTSTVRGFTCEAGELVGRVDPAPGTTRLEIPTLQAAVRGAELKVPVTSLDCGNGTMNNHLRKALHARTHPAVEFRLSGHEVAVRGSDHATVKLNGRLKIAGQEKPIAIEAVATPAGDGAVRVRGSKEIAMTEFGVKPPSLMMGTMKVRDRVTVHFDVVLRP